jgi:hypothetical protein
VGISSHPIASSFAPLAVVSALTYGADGPGNCSTWPWLNSTKSHMASVDLAHGPRAWYGVIPFGHEFSEVFSKPGPFSSVFNLCACSHSVGTTDPTPSKPSAAFGCFCSVLILLVVVRPAQRYKMYKASTKLCPKALAKTGPFCSTEQP